MDLRDSRERKEKEDRLLIKYIPKMLFISPETEAIQTT